MPGKNRSTSKRIVPSSIAIMILLFDLLMLYYFKYKNQGLPFSKLNILYTGNFLNAIFTFLAILGVIVYAVRMKSKFKSILIILFPVLLTVFLFIAYESTKIHLPLPNIYFIDHPLSLILIGALFSFYQYLQFMFIAVLWFNILGGKELILVRAIFDSAALVLLLLALTFVYINLKKNFRQGFSTDKHLENVAVVLGAAVWSHNSPSPSLAARADKAVELYKKGIVNKIQLTGGNAPGEMTEAEVADNYIKLSKINSKDIWLENKTVSTADQIRYIKDSILTKPNIGKIIIVSDSYHLTRVHEMCGFFGVKAGLAASNLKMNFEHNLYYKFKESIALLVFWFFAL